MIQGLVLAVLVSVSSGQFLFGNSGPGGFGCAPVNAFCPLRCPEYEKDARGCEICHCKGDGKAATQKGTETDHSNSKHHSIGLPCTPAHMHCQLKCEAFVTGPGGCEYCMCKHVTHNVETTTSEPARTTTIAATTTTTKSTTTVQPTTAMPMVAGTTISQDCIIAKQICSAKCDGKYLVDPSDCTFCICKSELGMG